VRALLYDAHERFASVDEGQNAKVYPALEAVPRDLFGIAVVATEGAIYAVGDAEYPFSIMSVSKPFVFALVCQRMRSGPGSG
jgi:glutaminase